MCGSATSRRGQRDPSRKAAAGPSGATKWTTPRASRRGQSGPAAGLHAVTLRPPRACRPPPAGGLRGSSTSQGGLGRTVEGRLRRAGPGFRPGREERVADPVQHAVRREHLLHPGLLSALMPRLGPTAALAAPAPAGLSVALAQGRPEHRGGRGRGRASWNLVGEKRRDKAAIPAAAEGRDICFQLAPGAVQLIRRILQRLQDQLDGDVPMSRPCHRGQQAGGGHQLPRQRQPGVLAIAGEQLHQDRAPVAVRRDSVQRLGQVRCHSLLLLHTAIDNDVLHHVVAILMHGERERVVDKPLEDSLKLVGLALLQEALDDPAAEPMPRCLRGARPQ
mmetsp:Transcript_127673/g.367438  ORF Transcript_127673/g.367438 Transcript_127673/m.367438 type:complete len:334 (-) Transcript_127673:483-1484(-)